MPAHRCRDCKKSKKELKDAQQLLVSAYESGHREGWEPGPSVDETMELLKDYLSERGINPFDPIEMQTEMKKLMKNG